MSLHLPKCHNVGNHMSWLIYRFIQQNKGYFDFARGKNQFKILLLSVLPVYVMDISPNKWLVRVFLVNMIPSSIHCDVGTSHV